LVRFFFLKRISSVGALALAIRLQTMVGQELGWFAHPVDPTLFDIWPNLLGAVNGVVKAVICL
jgi:hypothetical protein